MENRVNMNPFNFELKTKVKFGINESNRLPIYLEELKYKKIGIVLDHNFEENDQVIDLLNETVGSFDAAVYSYEFGEPTYQQLEQDRNFFKNDLDCIIGIGGGSVIDFAKGLALLLKNPNPALSYRGFPENINQPIPIIAIPTTAGTGSEVTFNAVFVDSPEHKKLGINTKLNFPVLALLDPLLVQSCPKSVMVSCGMDALTHAIESYGATKSNSITKALSIQAINILTWKLQYIKDKTDLDTCADLQLGAYLAGAALMNSGSGPAGALSYILGPNFNVPHGLAGAIFLPHIIKHNEEQSLSVYSDLEFLTDLSEIVFDLCKRLDINCYDLHQFGVNDSNLNILLKGVEKLQPAFDQNPVPFTVEDAKSIIKKMI